MRGTDNSNQNHSLWLWFRRMAKHLLNLIQHITKKPKPGQKDLIQSCASARQKSIDTVMVVYFYIYPVIQAQEVSPTAESPSTSTAGMCRTIQFHAIYILYNMLNIFWHKCYVCRVYENHIAINIYSIINRIVKDSVSGCLIHTKILCPASATPKKCVIQSLLKTTYQQRW